MKKEKEVARITFGFQTWMPVYRWGHSWEKNLPGKAGLGESYLGLLGSEHWEFF